MKCLFITFAVLLLGLVGCSAGSEGRTTARTAYYPLSLELEVDHSGCLKGGETLKIRYTVKNVGTQPFVIESKEIPILDILVQEVDIRRLSWSEQNPEKVSHHLEWQPGGVTSLETTWVVPRNAFSPGRIVNIHGLLADGSRLVQGATVTLCLGVPFEIPPP